MLRPHPGSSGGYWRQQCDIEAAPAHAWLPGIVTPAQHELVFLDRHDDRLPPAVLGALMSNDEIADRDGLPACRARGSVAVVRGACPNWSGQLAQPAKDVWECDRS